MDPLDESDWETDYTGSDYEDEDYEDSDFENEEEEQQQIEKFANMIHSAHKPVQFEGLVGIRMLLSRDEFPLIQEVLDSGVLPKILEMMTWEDESQFQVESAWCVINISAGKDEFSDHLIELGGLDIVINLLDSPLSDIVDQAVWTICNIAATSAKHRDICLQKDCLSKLLQTLERFPNSDSITEHVLNSLAELSRGKGLPQWEKVRPTLPVLYKHISEVHSQQTLFSALWSLAYISDERIQEVIDQGCVPFLMQHLCEGSEYVLGPAFKALGNILTGNDKQANEVLNYPEFLPRIFEITNHPNKIYRKEAFWAISNIAAGTSEQVEMLMKNENYMQRIKIAVVEESTEAAREAAWTITNMFSSATSEQIHRIIYKHGLLKHLARILMEFDDDLKQNVLEAIRTVLETVTNCKEKESYIKEIKEAGLVEIIRDLAKQEGFSTNADNILNHFSVENPEESEYKDQEDSDRED